LPGIKEVTKGLTLSDQKVTETSEVIQLELELESVLAVMRQVMKNELKPFKVGPRRSACSPHPPSLRLHN
jgi:hypothetical protein